jgi:hypothetical protein
MSFVNIQEAQAAWHADQAMLEASGVYLPGVRAYVPDAFKRDFNLAMDSLSNAGLAMDAQPGLMGDPNSAVPAMLTAMIDPAVFKILFAPNRAAAIFGEARKGTWLDETIMFPTVEHTGEVSSYGDYNENGRAGANTNWPQRQAYLFQTVKEYGERELERAGLARINWISEVDQAAATVLHKFLNLTYFYGVSGLQNYGLLNDPNLTSALTPATKAWGGTTWFNGTAPAATANEVYNDILAIYEKLVSQANGLIDDETKLVLAFSPASSVALKFTNSFGLTVRDMLKESFPNLRIETAIQYGVLSTSNPQGLAGGNLVQIIAEEVEGQDTGFCSFNEKMRAHPIVRAMSSFKQKITAGTWGAVIRQPFAIAQMLGV